MEKYQPTLAEYVMKGLQEAAGIVAPVVEKLDSRGNGILHEIWSYNARRIKGAVARKAHAVYRGRLRPSAKLA